MNEAIQIFGMSKLAELSDVNYRLLREAIVFENASRLSVEECDKIKEAIAEGAAQMYELLDKGRGL